MSTHNVCFYGEILENHQIPSLSVPLNSFVFFQKEHFDLLELFLNSEYDPNKTDTAAISDCESLVETVAKQKFLSTQVIYMLFVHLYLDIQFCVVAF